MLGGYRRRWLKDETIPDAHRSDPNATGIYRPIIARMMDTTPDKIWSARTPARTVAGELKDRRDRTAGQLTDQRRNSMTCAARHSSSGNWKAASPCLKPSCATSTPSSRSRPPGELPDRQPRRPPWQPIEDGPGRERGPRYPG